MNLFTFSLHIIGSLMKIDSTCESLSVLCCNVRLLLHLLSSKGTVEIGVVGWNSTKDKLCEAEDLTAIGMFGLKGISKLSMKTLKV
jgi:hypothetical protein